MGKTKKDLRDELAALGFVATEDETKADLATLLAEVNTGAPVFTDDSDTTAATVGPTGLCLQCHKPADHIHRGE